MVKDRELIMVTGQASRGAQLQKDGPSLGVQCSVSRIRPWLRHYNPSAKAH